MIAPAAVGCTRLLANGQLDARTKMNGCRVLDVKHSTRLRVRRLRGGVHHERAHRDDSAALSDALQGHDGIGKPLDLVVW
jgi:hypothetical protein